MQKSFLKDMEFRLQNMKFLRFLFSNKFSKTRNFPMVIKADGLAAGKGVSIVKSFTESVSILDDIFHKKVFGTAGSKIIIEDFIPGEELSYICMINSYRHLSFASSQDHKARDDGGNGQIQVVWVLIPQLI